MLIVSLLFGMRHHEVLLGVREVPTAEQRQQIIQSSIEIFMLKYEKKP
jgi:TetR/AcrR family transcriptional repressor of mexJK operon